MPSETPRPNVLMIMCDQLAAQATSPYGNSDVLTPNLDELARRGTVFERSYCNAPLCAPSRASMLTGRLASEIPVNDNSEELAASVPTFLHSLRREGYRTILSGKMHFVGPDQLHGFEERLTTDIFPSDYLWTRYWPSQGDPPRSLGPASSGSASRGERREYAQMLLEAGPIRWNYQRAYDEEVHYQAMQRLRHLGRQKSPTRRPWFLCVSYTQPHDPYVAPPEYWDRYEGAELALPEGPPSGYEPHPADIWTNTFHGLDQVKPTDQDARRSRRGYYAMISYIDDKVGEFLAALDALGLADETLVVFTSDHGDQLGERGMWFKRTMHEWSVRVPLLMAGPEVRAGQRVDQNVSLMSLYPTFLEMAKAEAPQDVVRQVTSPSLMPLIRGESHPDWPDQVVIENNSEGTIKPVRALVEGRYKYVYVHDLPDQLYELESDPNEWNNLAADPTHAGQLAEMRGRALEGWDPSATEDAILASQRLRMFLREALAEGTQFSWDYAPGTDPSHTWVRRTSNEPWDPDLDVKFWGS